MSTTVAAPRRAVAPAPGRDARDHESRRRGRLDLSDKVIEKIAGQAAAEIGAAHGKSGGLLGIGAHADASARPKVDVQLSASTDVSGSSADIAIEVGIAYPRSIRQATQEIRDHVVRQVQDLTGVAVHRLDIDVSFLTVNGTDTKKESLR